MIITQEQMFGRDERHLTAINDSHKLLPSVVQDFMLMQSEAKKNGIDIQICSSFRNFERQLSIWNRKWQGNLPIYSISGELLTADKLTDEEKIHGIMLWSALPGASRHHWGSDFDVYDAKEVALRAHTLELVPSEYENGGPCAQMSLWIQENAERFGFYFPYHEYNGGVAREPWHMSHKESSTDIIKRFDINALSATLEKADINGKASILAQLPELVRRYTLNEGKQASCN